jgi:purine-binding chemotaxis protein CheW
MQAHSQATDRHDYLVFQVGGREYGIALENVQELTTYCAVKPIAGAPQAVAGAITLRNHQLPVLNLHEVLTLDDADTSKLSDVVVVRHAGNIGGVAVDCVLDVLSVGSEQVRTTLRACDAESGFLNGIAKLDRRVVALLNPEKLVADFQPGPATRLAA